MAVNPVAAGRQKWSLTQEALNGLLASLAPDRDIAAERYLEMRKNLVRLFEWRGSATPEEDADEAINRCAKRIAEGEEIRDLATYAIGVARMVLLEKQRERVREARSLEEVPEPQCLPDEPASDGKRGVECLRRCLAELSPDNRDLILTYYHGEKGQKIKNRKRLTELFSVPAGTLRMRALRLRERLQTCAEDCIQQKEAMAL
jgi:DNA-directed RNA polymerase specialized sigma24 family protein